MIVSASPPPVSFSRLPDDILREISQYLDVKELGTVFSRVCKQFHRISEPKMQIAKQEIEDFKTKYPFKLIEALGGPLKFYRIPKGNLGNYAGDDYNDFMTCIHQKMPFPLMRGEDAFLSKTQKVFIAFRLHDQNGSEHLSTDTLLKVLIKNNTLPSGIFMDLDQASSLYPYIGRLFKGEPCGKLQTKKHMCFKKWVEVSPKIIYRK